VSPTRGTFAALLPASSRFDAMPPAPESTLRPTSANDEIAECTKRATTTHTATQRTTATSTTVWTAARPGVPA
jgi:hypothetical protein